ncbi:MAG: RNA polymerase sigma factor [Firmicutes bacterium]|nr:RNA polymerase sigma factor [Bacillota bacterium]
MARWNLKMKDPEIDLCIQRVADGDSAAFKTLYDAFYKPIYLFGLSIVKDHQLAEDVLQDTFLSVLASAGTYRRGTKPRAWMFAIARNASLAALKNSQNKAFLDIDEIEQTAAATPGLYGEHSVDEVEALSILTPEEREIVVLYVYAGFRQTEIAHIMQMAYSEVRSRYGYALKKLKRHYALEGGIRS